LSAARTIDPSSIVEQEEKIVITTRAAALGATVVASCALVGASVASAAEEPVFAGLTTDGSVYRAGDDGLWHRVAAASNLVTWYGDLPGSLAPEPSDLTAAEPAAHGLAGLIADGTVYAAGADGLWHEIPAAKFAMLGFGDGLITWYGELPGSVGDPIGS
jgi:hypothetical protein